MNSSVWDVWAELAVRKKSGFEFFWATFEGVFSNFLRAKKNDFFFENIVESFHIFLVFLMILFTAEPLRFFIYISVCCWTFELSLLLNLWDYLLLLNLWDYALDYVSVYCWTFGFFLLLNIWDYAQRYTYRVLQTIQMKLILLCVWAEPAILGSIKTT